LSHSTIFPESPGTVKLPKSSRGGVMISASATPPRRTGICKHGGRSSSGISKIRRLDFDELCAKDEEQNKNAKIKNRLIFFI
jgi:hypothetical protein